MEFAPSLDIVINETLPALEKVCQNCQKPLPRVLIYLINKKARKSYLPASLMLHSMPLGFF